jgi:hypothetical protein
MRRKDFAVNPDELSVNRHERADKALRVVGIDAKAGRKTGQKHKRASKPRYGPQPPGSGQKRSIGVD